MGMNSSSIVPITLVLLDPTSPDGESSLQLLDSTDRHVVLMVLLSGPTSRSLRDFARSEELDMATAGWCYLEQVGERLMLAPEQMLAMTARGPSAATELADVVVSNETHRVLLPSSVDRDEPGLADLLARCTDAPVLTAPVLAHAG